MLATLLMPIYTYKYTYIYILNEVELVAFLMCYQTKCLFGISIVFCSMNIFSCELTHSIYSLV